MLHPDTGEPVPATGLFGVTVSGVAPEFIGKDAVLRVRVEPEGHDGPAADAERLADVRKDVGEGGENSMKARIGELLERLDALD